MINREYNDMMMRLVEWIGTPVSITMPEEEWCRQFVDKVKGVVESCSEDYKQGYYQYLQDNLMNACRKNTWAIGNRCLDFDWISSILKELTNPINNTGEWELYFNATDKVKDFLAQIENCKDDGKIALVVVKFVKAEYIVNGLQRKPIFDFLKAKGYVECGEENWRKHIDKWEKMLRVQPV